MTGAAPADDDDSQERQSAFDNCVAHVMRLRKAGTADEKIWEMLSNGLVVAEWANQLVEGCEKMLEKKAT